jgi:hypothetical protein
MVGIRSWSTAMNSEEWRRLLKETRTLRVVEPMMMMMMMTPNGLGMLNFRPTCESKHLLCRTFVSLCSAL